MHSYVQALVCAWFVQHESEWDLLAMPEVRSRVRQDRFRLPDVGVAKSGTEFGRVLTEAPLIAIEIPSSDDTFSDLLHRAADFRRMGTANIWLLNPEDREAFLGTEAGWAGTALLEVPHSPVHLDLQWLWAGIDRHFLNKGSAFTD